jgi:hypothetical protein
MFFGIYQFILYEDYTHTNTYTVPVVRVGERIFFGGHDPSFAVTLTLPTIITLVVVGAVIIN